MPLLHLRQPVLLTFCDFRRFFAMRASRFLISAHPNWPKFIVSFMGSAALKLSMARFDYNTSRLFLIAGIVPRPCCHQLLTVT